MVTIAYLALYNRSSMFQKRGMSTHSVDPDKKAPRPKITRNMSAPWTPGGAPKDEIQVELLRDLAGYLTMVFPFYLVWSAIISRRKAHAIRCKHL
jgi:hypothetical protein